MDLPNKPTPGPWTVEGFEQTMGHGQFYGGLIMGADGETIVAQCVAPHNAQLIAAAPDMLQALEDAELELMLHTETNPSPALDAVRAAMAKAINIKEHNQ